MNRRLPSSHSGANIAARPVREEGRREEGGGEEGGGEVGGGGRRNKGEGQ